MLHVFKTAARVAASDATVLILGESGTGKELVARALHQSSPRAAGPFVPVDCGALAEGVLESELFGHARGAFTGAQSARRGLFEEASGGTLFLDEIGDVGPGLQARLLRVLQEGTIRRVGTNEAIPVDARVVAATNRDLEAAVKEGRFREDLFYRLNVVTLRIPPLRDRREDVPLLAEHFAAKHGRGEGAAVSREARELLAAYDWPGNVRELENVIARALALNPSGVVVPADLPERVRAAGGHPEPARGLVLPAGFRPPLEELGRRYAALVLAECAGNKTRAAEVLGIDRKTLYRIVGEGE
jgi:DNA-binding NtrC family response regulator